jgi:hypothetical protein
MMRTLGVALVAAFLGGCGTTPTSESGEAPWSLQLSPSPLDPGAGSMGPQLTTSAAGLILSWMASGEGDTSLTFAEYAGRAWSTPQEAARGPDWFVSEVDMPAVLRLSDRSIVAQWLVAVDLAKEAYDIRLARSQDDGRTWTPMTAPHHDGTVSQHGFASLYEWPAALGGGLGLAWLDGRAMQPGPTSQLTGDMGLFHARFDAAGRQRAEAPINPRVCECCSTSAAVAAAGPVVAFRDRSATDVRDIGVTRFADGRWQDAVTVHADNWTLDACPVNGPAIAAAGRQVAVAWFAAPGDDGHAFAAFSEDGGRTFGTPTRLDDVASLGSVGITLLPDGAALASWVEFNEGASFRVRRVSPSGLTSPAQPIAGGNGRFVSGIPRVARHGDTIVLAWTESQGETPGAAQRVRVMTAALPR